MMGGHHQIYLYAPAGPPVDGATLIPCTTEGQRIMTFGSDDPNRLPAWPTDAQSALFNSNAATLIKAYAEPHDIILLTGGLTHKPIADALPPNTLCVEPGVGYDGIFTNYCAFESYAWRHTVYRRAGIEDGRWFDTVIPNYFDPLDFPHLNEGKGEYLLFLGRLIFRKGPQIAAEIADACGLPLWVAGAGGTVVNDNLIEGQGVSIKGKNLRYIGPVDARRRAILLAGAKALIVPTNYIEPFGGVAVEAMMAGTPAITSDWGAFTETVVNGVSGYRIGTLSEAKAAVEKTGSLDPAAVRQSALDRYSLTAVAPQFDQWFARLQNLWGKGWYEV
jgi:glycosyltransferase involved in cell wall biosynthesis